MALEQSSVVQGIVVYHVLRGERFIKKKKKYTSEHRAAETNKRLAEMWSGSKEDSSLRLIDWCITQLKVRK